jgi:outer membrane lipoprotein-sorting protein
MRTIVSSSAVFIFSLSFAPAPSGAAELNLAGVLDHLDDMYSGQSSHSKLTMHVATEHATRDMTMESWSKGHDDVLVRILAPEKEQGTTTLKKGDNVWNYFPKINQVTKVSPSMMSASWMGSHITNSDIVKHGRYVDDYTYSKTFEGERAGEKVVELTLIPKPNAPVVWGKVVITVRLSDQNPVQIQYFNEAKALSQTWTYADIKDLGGRKLPGAIKVVPAQKPKESTEVRYHTIQFDLALEDALFSQRALRQ